MFIQSLVTVTADENPSCYVGGHSCIGLSYYICIDKNSTVNYLV